VFLQFSARDPEALGIPPAHRALGADDLVTEMQIPVAARGAGRGRE
jgi:hypothetical protein